MKNIPIIGKLLAIIAIFGVFSIATAIYSTSEIHAVQADYRNLMEHETAAAIGLSRGSRALETSAAAIGDLLISNTPEGNQSAKVRFDEAREQFIGFMSAAQAALPAQLDELQALQARGLHVIDVDCAATIKLGAAATEDAAMLSSQRVYLSDCAPKFLPVTQAFKAKVDLLVAEVHQRSEALERITTTTIQTTYAMNFIGLAAVIALGFFAVRFWITSPLGALNKTMEQLAGGDLNVTVSGDDRKDELGSMARTVQVFKEAAVKNRALQREVDERMTAIGRAQAVIEFDLDGTIITANENFLKTMDYSLADIQGRHHSMFVDASEANSPEYKELWRSLNRGEFVAKKFRRLGRGGREVWIQGSYNALFDNTGKPYRVVKFASDITELEQERAAAEKRQAFVVESLATGLSRLSEGDLVFRLNAEFAVEYEKLRTDFNAAMETLAETMRVVSANASSIHSGTGEISTAADDLSRRTEQQAASLEETAAALDEITATVSKTAEGALHARDVVGAAKGDAEKSGEVVRDAVTAMSGIEKSSNQISQIIGVIDEIAFQTNLLALNAGVEAARAGDAGRGFAVVASEVRALAQRSADAAKEIKSLISASGQQVSSGVALVGETGRSLERIVNQVAEINGIVAEIAASAQEQATALNQVNTAVNQMDQVTQQNAAMVEETTAASHSLAHEAQELSRLIAKFDVGRNAESEPSRSFAATSRPTAASAPRPALKAVSQGRPGGAARKLEAVVDESWEEF